MVLDGAKAQGSLLQRATLTSDGASSRRPSGPFLAAREDGQKVFSYCLNDSEVFSPPPPTFTIRLLGGTSAGHFDDAVRCL